MIVDKDVLIPVNDGHNLWANVYRPDAPGKFPVLMSMDIYGKDVHFADGYKLPWAKLCKQNPNIDRDGSSGKYLRWEKIDPERWVPDGYIVIAIDSRGSGKSPGYLDPFSPRETQDYYDAIEWAAGQSWSTGKIGLIGISYLSIKQWQVAALQPPHLAAICPWEGGCDLYRDWSHHGGIFSDLFPTAWYPRQVLPNQHGNGATSHIDRDTGATTTGLALSEEMLEGQPRRSSRRICSIILSTTPGTASAPLISAASKCRCFPPAIGAARVSTCAAISRGSLRVGLAAEMARMHVGTHFESFYLPAYVERQKRFFGHFLKGEDNGWLNEPERPTGDSFARTASPRASRKRMAAGAHRVAEVIISTQRIIRCPRAEMVASAHNS